MNINRSSNFSIKGKNTINHVHGHQFNAPINVVVSAEQAGTEYDEFKYIYRSDFANFKCLGSIDDRHWNFQNKKRLAQEKARKTMFTVDILDRESKFTAIFYEGKDARKSWQDDFQRFSKTGDLDILRLFGINQSIPALIFHHELIPLAHIFTGSIWMDIYIAHLRIDMGCSEWSLWMNTTHNVLCSGPDGPVIYAYTSPINYINVPRTIDMLKDDTSLRFFSKYGSSRTGVYWLTPGYETDTDHPAWISPIYPYVHRLWTSAPIHYQLMNDIEELRFDTVYSPKAVARRPQGTDLLWGFLEGERCGLEDETALDGGLIRFEFDPTLGRVRLSAQYHWWEIQRQWLSQSCRVFDALDVMEGEEKFFIVQPPMLRIEHDSCPYDCPAAFFNLCDGNPSIAPIEDLPPRPVYVFIRPLPMTLSELVSWHKGRPYFWSFDKTGQSEMSEEECERWGLPVLSCTTCPVYHYAELHTWPISTYTALRDWQEARGFDPTTSDWARELGYPEWEIIGAKKSNILEKMLSFTKKRKWGARGTKPWWG